MKSGEGFWSFTAQDQDRLHRLLETYRAQSRARYVTLVDRGGQLLAAVGDGSGVDDTAFASLAAADFAASDQLAQLLGEKEFTSLWHQGDREGMFLHGVGGTAILAVLFDFHSTLGLLRLRSRQTVPHLLEMMQEAAARPSSERPGLEEDWLSEAENEIDRLFGG